MKRKLQPLTPKPTKQWGLLQVIVTTLVVVPPSKGGSTIHLVLLIDSAARKVRL